MLDMMAHFRRLVLCFHVYGREVKAGKKSGLQNKCLRIGEMLYIYISV